MQADYELARGWLDDELYALFCTQHPRDIRHSAGTARWLLRRGHTGPDLIAAALLHDIGKGDQRRWERVAYVVAGRAGLVSYLADPHSAAGWRRALDRSLNHCETGARLLADAGASARVIDLTLRHHDAARGDAILELLQAADAAS